MVNFIGKVRRDFFELSPCIWVGKEVIYLPRKYKHEVLVHFPFGGFITKTPEGKLFFEPSQEYETVLLEVPTEYSVSTSSNDITFLAVPDREDSHCYYLFATVRKDSGATFTLKSEGGKEVTFVFP